jgi:hypothetical protein
MTSGDEFLTGKLAAEDADVAAYGFMKWLMMRNAKTYTALLNALRGGQEFDQAFAAIYRNSPAIVAQVWASSAPRTTKRKR